MDIRGIQRIARLIARRTHGHGSVTITDARNALASADRPYFVQATMHAIAAGWVDRARGTDLLHATSTPPPDETRMGLVAELDKAQDELDLRS